MVPTSDTVRNQFLIHLVVEQGFNILFSGPTGTAKIASIQGILLLGFNSGKYSPMALAFSAQTTANQCQDFIDDLNMPFKETYGAQPPIGILRQMFILTPFGHGWYDRKGWDFRQLVDLHAAVCLPVSGGSAPSVPNARASRDEKWLLEVQQAMMRCLTETTGRSFLAYAGGDCATWVLEWPAQCVIAVDNVYWTKEVAAAIEEGKLDEYHKKCIQQLLGIVVLVCGDLS